MPAEYMKSEKLWRSPCPEIKYSSLGEVIFSKLNEGDPKRVLEVNHESGTESTVDDIRRQTITVAQNLRRLGVNKGDTVILYSQSNERVAPITFACLAIGAPVNFFQTGFKENFIISHYFELLDPAVIIFEEEFREQIFICREGLQLEKLKYTLSIHSNELFQPTIDGICFQPTQIEDPTKHAATLIFTSGSSGMPKIVVLSHAMMLNGLNINKRRSGLDTIICCICDLRWTIQISVMIQTVLFGIKRVYTSRPESEISVEEKRIIIDRHKITDFTEVPKYYLELLASAERSKVPKSLSSLKYVLVVGEFVTESLVNYSKRVIPHCKVIKRYGMTELLGPVCTNDLINKNNLNGGTLKDGFIVKIIDDEGSSLGPNQAGRLVLKSTVPFMGYLKNEKANEKAFLEGGWYDTGDYALMDSENLLHILGRYSNLLRSSGTVLVPSVVESIVDSHPSIFQSALVGHVSLHNSKDHVGTLFVVPAGDHQFTKKTEGELRELLSKKLTDEQMDMVRFIRVISELPISELSVKTDTNALKVLAEKLKNTNEN